MSSRGLQRVKTLCSGLVKILFGVTLCGSVEAEHAHTTTWLLLLNLIFRKLISTGPSQEPNLIV